MSLTRILETARGRNVLKPLMVNKPNRISEDIVATPHTKHYTKIGIAFDYLLRWYVECNYRSKTNIRDKWMAEMGAELVCNGYCLMTGVDEWWDDNPTSAFIFEAGTSDDYARRLAKTAKQIFDDAKAEYERYMHTGKADHRTAAAVLGLPLLDSIVSAYSVEQLNYTKVDQADIADVLNLHDALEKSKTLRATLDRVNDIHFNPTFGEYSEMVGGTDAGIIAGDTIIDIKTTLSPEFKSEYWMELLGYCALANASQRRIQKLGVYFSRFGILQVIDAPDADWIGIATELADVRRIEKIF